MIDRRTVLAISLLGFAAICLSAVTYAAALDEPDATPPKPFAFPLYAFNNSMRGSGLSDPAAQSALLKEMGYAGIEGYDLTALPKLAEEIQKRGLKVFTVYLQVDIDGDGDPYDPRIETYLPTFLKDTGVTLTVHLHSETYGPSDAAGDGLAVPILRKLADLAHTHGARVAVYHHARFWAETIDDGVRIAKKVNRRNFGAAFNLCHWLWKEGEVELDATLDSAGPYLMSVSICGADGGEASKGSGWNRLIRPLDEGSFDNRALLRSLADHGYDGPVGLQCYNIKAPAKEHLRRSMEAWKSFGTAEDATDG